MGFDCGIRESGGQRANRRLAVGRRKHRLHLFGYIVNRWVTLLLYDGIGVNFFGGGIWEGLRVIAAKGLWSVAKEAFSSLAEGVATVQGAVCGTGGADRYRFW